MVFVDRLLVKLVHLRHGVTHDALACWFGVDRSTITRAIGEVRPLLAERGCTVTAGVRLRPLAEVVDHLGVTREAAEIRVQRPAVGRKGDRGHPAVRHAARTAPRVRANCRSSVLARADIRL
ncbi:transposase family protein [Streptomyces sp. NPDC001312]|uniref:helix-turn-helix domain-containing protein n=1 Tax=Streptomyces sp. NPDC001312 TaxID=3364561 RepID=UPI0036A2E507